MTTNAFKSIRLMGRDLETGQALFYLLILIHALVILATFTEYGITVDEPPQAAYGKAIFEWITHFFQDRTFFSQIRTIGLEPYGGFFDTLVDPITRLLPLDRFDTRHLCNAGVGLLSLVVVYRLGASLGTSPTGFLAALCLILIPRYYGHTFNNPKDIPFALFYVLSIYCLTRCMDHLPRLSGRWIFKTGISIGLALSVRVGGLLLLGYMGLFFALRNIQICLYQQPKQTPWTTLVRPTLLRMIAIGAIAWTTMLAFWTRALVEPFTYPFYALRYFSHFTGHTTVFFEGKKITSLEVPWYYAPKWLILTLPEFAGLGLAAGIFFLVLQIVRGSLPFKGLSLKWGLIVFSTWFPLIYVILNGSPLYDGLRHFLFIFPTLALTVAAGLQKNVQAVPKRAIRLGWVGLTVLSAGLTVFDMVDLHPNQYVYFNRLFAGGLSEASQYYATDYWENSYKEGIRWIETQYTNRPSTRPLRLSAPTQNLKYLLSPDHHTFVPAPENIDLYLSTTREDQHRMVPGEIVHTVQRGGTNLLYIIRPDSTYQNDPFFVAPDERSFQLAWKHAKTGDAAKTVLAYQKALQHNPNNPIVLTNLARAYYLTGKYSEAIQYSQKAIALKPDYAKAHSMLGSAYYRLGKSEQALSAYRKTLELWPEETESYSNVGAALILDEKWDEAIDVLEQSLTVDTSDEQVWHLLALSYRHTGQLGESHTSINRALELAPTTFKHQAEYANLASAYYKQGHRDKAVAMYLDILELNPNLEEAHFNLGISYYKEKRYNEAIAAFKKALDLAPDNITFLLRLAVLYEKVGNKAEAARAYHKLKALKPDDPSIEARLQALGND